MRNCITVCVCVCVEREKEREIHTFSLYYLGYLQCTNIGLLPSLSWILSTRLAAATMLCGLEHSPVAGQYGNCSWTILWFLFVYIY